MISISIVSHGHGSMAKRVLGDLEKLCAGRIEIILTENIPESPAVDWSSASMPVKVLRNPEPRGFGANHNSAFRQASGEFFCVLNPDVRLTADPFPFLVDDLGIPRIGAVAPLIVASDGAIQDSAREFPTPASLLRKALGSGSRPGYSAANETRGVRRALFSLLRGCRSVREAAAGRLRHQSRPAGARCSRCPAAEPPGPGLLCEASSQRAAVFLLPTLFRNDAPARPMSLNSGCSYPPTGRYRPLPGTRRIGLRSERAVSSPDFQGDAWCRSGCR